MIDQNPQDGRGSSWTLLTGHGHVLVEIARNPAARMRDISAAAGITERAVQLIVADLEEAGYITRQRHGRRNRYTVNPRMQFRHPAQDGHRIGPLLDLLAAADDATTQSELGAELPNGRSPIEAQPAEHAIPQVTESTGRRGHQRRR